MADVNGAKVNGDMEGPAAAQTLGTNNDGEQPLSNGEQPVAQSDSQPANTQPTEAQGVSGTSTEQRGAGAVPAIDQRAAASTEPDSRPAVLIIGGLGMDIDALCYFHVY